MGKDFWGWAILGPVYPAVKPAIKDITSKPSGPPTPASAPAAPRPEDSLAKAQDDAAARKRASLLSGGQTNITGPQGAALEIGQVQKKSLLGQ